MVVEHQLEQRDPVELVGVVTRVRGIDRGREVLLVIAGRNHRVHLAVLAEDHRALEVIDMRDRPRRCETFAGTCDAREPADRDGVMDRLEKLHAVIAVLVDGRRQGHPVDPRCVADVVGVQAWRDLDDERHRSA